MLSFTPTARSEETSSSPEHHLKSSFWRPQPRARERLNGGPLLQEAVDESGLAGAVGVGEEAEGGHRS